MRLIFFSFDNLLPNDSEVEADVEAEVAAQTRSRRRRGKGEQEEEEEPPNVSDNHVIQNFTALLKFS